MPLTYIDKYSVQTLNSQPPPISTQLIQFSDLVQSLCAVTTMQSISQALPFYATSTHLPILNRKHQHLGIELFVTTNKSFTKANNEWICHRRNHITIDCSFKWKPFDIEGPLCISRGAQGEPIQQFALSISAETMGEGSSPSLIQYTSKRDEDDKFVPRKKIFSARTPQDSVRMPTSCIFERIHFQNSTYSRGSQQPCFIVVEFSANISRDKENWVTIATKKSHSVIVRGRNPSYYQRMWSRSVDTQISNAMKQEFVASPDNNRNTPSSSCARGTSESRGFPLTGQEIPDQVEGAVYPQGKACEIIDSLRFGINRYRPICSSTLSATSAERCASHLQEYNAGCTTSGNERSGCELEVNDNISW